jgi:hypothetical protein
VEQQCHLHIRRRRHRRIRITAYTIIRRKCISIFIFYMLYICANYDALQRDALK